MNVPAFLDTDSMEQLLASLRRLRGGPGSRLVRELARVERCEFVRLLLEAGARRSADALRRAALDDGPQDWFLRLAARPRWRARARGVLWIQLSRGADHEEFAFLAHLLDEPRATWPAGSAILARARRVLDGPVLAHAYARALEHEGAHTEATRAHVEALDRPAARTNARAFEALARLHRTHGRHARALMPIVCHCQTWPFTSVALAEALASAFVVGDTSAARTLAQALVGGAPGVPERRGAPSSGSTPRPRWREPRVVHAFARAARAAALAQRTLDVALSAALAGLDPHDVSSQHHACAGDHPSGACEPWPRPPSLAPSHHAIPCAPRDGAPRSREEERP